MPIFEYRCQTCGHCFEQLTFANDKPSDLTCTQCGDAKVEKLMSCANALGGAKSGLCAPSASRYS